MKCEVAKNADGCAVLCGGGGDEGGVVGIKGKRVDEAELVIL